MKLRHLCAVACAAQLAGWAVIGATTHVLPPLAAVVPLSVGLVLALGLIRAATTATSSARDPQPRTLILPRVVIAAVFVGIAALVIAAGVPS